MSNDTQLTVRLRKLLNEVEEEMRDEPNAPSVFDELNIALGLLRSWQLATEREYQTDELFRLRQLTKKICGEL